MFGTGWKEELDLGEKLEVLAISKIGKK